MQGLGVLIVLVLLGLGAFFIYFVFKQVQFVLQAINLYKEILNREDMIIKLMKDILQKICGSNIKEIEETKAVGREGNGARENKAEEMTLSNTWVCGCGTLNSNLNIKCIKCERERVRYMCRKCGGLVPEGARCPKCYP